MSDTVTISKKAPLPVAAWSASRLTRVLEATTESMKILAAHADTRGSATSRSTT